MKLKSSLLLLFITSLCFAQKKGTENWQLLDPKQNKTYGTASDKAYEILKDRTPKPVIVAVIDNGVDVHHEDLKDVIWTNEKEIPNNGIDDDKNGYIDDYYGWNFLGGKNGDINYEATELARIYHRLNRKFSSSDTMNLNPTDANKFNYFKTVRTKFISSQTEQENQMMTIVVISDFIQKVKKQQGGEFSKATVKKFTPENEQDKYLKQRVSMILSLGLKADQLEKEVEKGMGSYVNMVRYNRLNTDSIRQAVVGDDQLNAKERFYGNNNVIGPDAGHGTHVAGIIAANRTNSTGIKGVASNVKIMAIRAVPNGDERDKDIANAIRYAVDNGATIINMSFGKGYVTDPEVLEEAILYAMSKDVLLIHAAGNDSKNIDEETFYPTRVLSNGNPVSNWIEVGANGRKGGKVLVGEFSNYGKKSVDLFGPGVDIYSTVPGNKYETNSGTSMAAPAVAGVAAIIRSHFPELTANEVRDVMVKTVTPYTKTVKIPGTGKKTAAGKKPDVLLNELSVTGGMVNAANAVSYLLNESQKK